VGFEPTIPVFERAKSIHALDEIKEGLSKLRTVLRDDDSLIPELRDEMAFMKVA
jgi:hypothetical protein